MIFGSKDRQPCRIPSGLSMIFGSTTYRNAARTSASTCIVDSVGKEGYEKHRRSSIL
ncbi:unnamed protein product [Amoebophrya sp. A25]|nr:unnamed protein product [Amoebophrya sp. A25]|eukprot:GSA25T00025945001.1